MAGRVLLDTNEVIGLFEGQPAILEHLARCAEAAVPSIVPGELYFGALRSQHVEENFERISAFARSTPALPADAATGRCYGQIKADLIRRGRPIPDNDAWIAALAVQHDCAILTFDRHFLDVNGICVESPGVARGDVG
jgi:tRNA(fMet)-specific endonuclease VapC